MGAGKTSGKCCRQQSVYSARHRRIKVNRYREEKGLLSEGEATDNGPFWGCESAAGSRSKPAVFQRMQKDSSIILEITQRFIGNRAPVSAAVGGVVCLTNEPCVFICIL